MRALRNHLLLLAVTTGLTLGALPAAPLAQAATIAPRAVAVRSATLELSRDSAKVGATFDITGRATNAPKGTPVRVQRGVGDTWVTVGTTDTSARGAFMLKNLTAPEAGLYLYRALIPGTSGPISSDYTWLAVTPKHPPTIVSGYVQSGGPLVGSTVRIYLPGRAEPVRTTTTEDGYFVTRLPALPKRLRVEATGGTGPAGRFEGTMIGLTPNPTTHDSFYVNPVTTLLATYLDQHPETARAAATTKVLNLLGLKRYHNIEWALGGRPSYFDGVKFLRTAERHGGFDAYVASLVKRIDRPHASARMTMPRDQGSAIVGLIGADAAGFLGVAAQSASILSAGLGLMTVVGDLVGWSPGGATTGQILGAIDQVDSTLKVMQAQLSNLQTSMDTDFSDLSVDINEVGFAGAWSDLNTAYGNVSDTQADYADFVHDQRIVARCVPAPTPPSTTLVAPPGDCTTGKNGITNADVQAALLARVTDLSDYKADIRDLEDDDLTTSTDIFRDAVLTDGGSTPALTFLIQQYLARTGQVFLPAGSTLVADFTARALTNQAMAYYLIMAYEEPLHPGTPIARGRIAETSTQYLGPDYATWPQSTSSEAPPTTPTAPPASGSLHDEMSYLQSVLPVPEGAAVDTNPGGLMYVTSVDRIALQYYLPTDEASRGNCSTVEQFNTAYRDYPVGVRGGTAPSGGSLVCSALADQLRELDADMVPMAAAQGSVWAQPLMSTLPVGTFWSGLDTGWSFVTQGPLGDMLSRLNAAGYSEQDYFNPGPVTFQDTGDKYPIANDNVVCGESDGAPTCTDGSTYYLGPVIDALELYYKDQAGNDQTCSWAVGEAADDYDDPCLSYSLLISRPLQSGEVYNPLEEPASGAS